ncbi:MAG: alpha-ketoacid dehydrogenase subunit beta [Spirochaeta sp.]|jgi:pyruvate/2-oxoglutarate/acetoin dehydrogenase E1 component|nr:alpha-ketoacid dehydrogenase subunit beta [Spirochaeta sp.]
MSNKKIAVAIRDVIAEEMRRDESVFVMGEDIGAQGGVFGCTRGLQTEFGKTRVRDTPIAEAVYVGLGVGAALTGMRPIIDFMYLDFTYVAMDQLLNQAAKLRYMYGGRATLPMVIRGQQGIGRGNAGTHSQSVEVIFTHIPGLKVVMPSNAYDAAGLLRTAIRDNNPVMIFEHKALYVSSEEVPDDPDFMIPFGKAAIKREGSDVTIVATSLMVQRAMEAADKLAEAGISAEVIDPRTLLPLDIDTLVESVKKTGRALVVHEAHKTSGIGAEIGSQISEHAFKYLDAPVARLGAKPCTLPFSLVLENAVVPGVDDIVESARDVCYR